MDRSCLILFGSFSPFLSVWLPLGAFVSAIVGCHELTYNSLGEV